jgi:hypothetical protein
MSSRFGAPDWGVFFLAIPFLCALPLVVLRLQARFARPGRRRRPVPGMGIEDGGRRFCTGPDNCRTVSCPRAK